MKTTQAFFGNSAAAIAGIAGSTPALAQSRTPERLEARLSFGLDRALAGGDCRLQENLFAEVQGNTLLLRTKDLGFSLFGKGTRRVACTLAVPVTLPEGYELVAVQEDVTYWARKSQGASANGSVAFSAGFTTRMASPTVVDLGESSINGFSFFRNNTANVVTGIPKCSSVRETNARVNLILSGIGSADSDELKIWWRSDDVQKITFLLAPCEL